MKSNPKLSFDAVPLFKYFYFQKKNLIRAASNAEIPLKIDNLKPINFIISHPPVSCQLFFSRQTYP
jgi:hypothetical protein